MQDHFLGLKGDLAGRLNVVKTDESIVIILGVDISIENYENRNERKG